MPAVKTAACRLAHREAGHRPREVGVVDHVKLARCRLARRKLHFNDLHGLRHAGRRDIAPEGHPVLPYHSHTMRRADRLFHLVQLIRGRRLSTAEFLAKRLEVSERTIYRDVADLQHQGVPIEGEAGVGYRLGAGFDLPPLMFTQKEANALAASVRLAQAWLDPAMAGDAETAWSKIVSVLPPAARATAEGVPLYAVVIEPDAATQRSLQLLREAVHARRKVKMRYLDAGGRESRRVLWPLGCFYWGSVWTLGAWCEARQDFRSFRVDRMAAVEVLDERVGHEAGRTLADYLRSVKASTRPP
jgi:predicted DNA-binding transcriptional regulator YafY